MDDKAAPRREGTPYQRAILGFRNFWYPVLTAKKVTERGVALKLLGDEILFLRRNGVVYAIANLCPHRGFPLSKSLHIFKGTNTITCGYHGFTYDVASGRCVAALTDGPGSCVEGRFRVRTYPIEIRKGIVWIWMGREAPSVPVEKDIPGLMLRDDALVRVRCKGYRGSKDKVRDGNWRYHAENGGNSHSGVVHRDAVVFRYRHQLPAHPVRVRPTITEGPDGVYLTELKQSVRMKAQYPGLGEWPERRPLRNWVGRMLNKIERNRRPFGVPQAVSMRMPGIVRVCHPEMHGDNTCYWEWYLPVDETHYMYFQTVAAWKNGWFSKLCWLAYYHVWVAPFAMGQFNDQDSAMVQATTRYAIMLGRGIETMESSPSPLFGADSITRAWIKMCNETARGEDTLPSDPETWKPGAIVCPADPLDARAGSDSVGRKQADHTPAATY